MTNLRGPLIGFHGLDRARVGFIPAGGRPSEIEDDVFVGGRQAWSAKPLERSRVWRYRIYIGGNPGGAAPEKNEARNILPKTWLVSAVSAFRRPARIARSNSAEVGAERLGSGFACAADADALNRTPA